MTTPTVTDFLPPFPTIGLPPDEVVDALVAGAVGIHRRAEIYEADGITPFAIDDWDSRLTGGSVTVDMTRDERRMCDLEFNNWDFALNLNPVNGFWYDKIIKMFWGIEYYNSDGDLSRWEMQVGEFMIDTIAEDFFPNVCKVTGRDYTKKCIVSEILNSIQFDSTTPVEVIIKALAANSGISKFRLPYTGLSFADTVVFDPGTARWEVMKRLADSVGYEIYFTSDGYLTMRPYQDPVLSPVSWIFRTGQPDGTLVTYRRTSNDSRVKNHCVVIGNTQTDSNGFSITAFGEARNDDPSSPTYIKRIGDRVDTFKSSYITDNDVAQALADARLRVASLEEYSIDFSSLILPFIDAGDIVDILNPNESSYVPARFLLSNYTLPFGLGAMTGVGRRVTIVGTKRTFGVF
jgi:hypothetical protein